MIISLRPQWIASSEAATHGSATTDDQRVPILLMGPGVKPGLYDQAVSPADIAPTLATLLGVETPSGSVGRALAEIFAEE